jgi:hypothetical protein
MLDADIVEPVRGHPLLHPLTTVTNRGLRSLLYREQLAPKAIHSAYAAYSRAIAREARCWIAAAMSRLSISSIWFMATTIAS